MTDSRKPAAVMPSSQDAHDRLREIKNATNGLLELSPEQGLRLMQERARQFAAAPTTEQHAGSKIEVLVFNFNNERYALDTSFIHEIAPLAELAPLPGVPAHFLGLTSVRGELFAVVDLRLLLGLHARAMTDLFRVILVGRDRPELGLLVDSTHEVRTLWSGDLSLPTASRQEVRGGLIRGVAADALIVLDGEALVSDERLFIEQTLDVVR